VQRFLDVLFSLSALVLLAPLLIPVALVLRLTGEGEVFFRQNRIGRYGKTFQLLKFATMLKNSPSIGTGTITLRDDPRVLPVGRFLRKTKINELPQLLNILMGDMSLIGPRPQTLRCFQAFPEPSQEIIKKVRPGLSGVGSIVFRNEEEMMSAHNAPDFFYDNTIMPYKGELEEWYVSHQGLKLYVMLIVLTTWVVASSDAGVMWRFFPTLPKPPKDLMSYMESS
jgi:lipopolysaccharide/colanic/teichoic acid biosynthesis glycosyltransferase